MENALRAYTSGGAYAMFDEKNPGTLEPGKLADLTVLDRDITRIATSEIRNAKVTMTIVGGRVVYQRSGTP